MARVEKLKVKKSAQKAGATKKAASRRDKAASVGVAKPNAMLAKAMKVVESGKAEATKVWGLALRLPPADRVTVLRALLERTHPRSQANVHGWLAEAEAHAGLFAPALENAKKAYARESSLLTVGALALEAKRPAESERAFSAMKGNTALKLIGIAVAMTKLGNDPKAVLARATKLLAVAGAKPTNFASATACYDRVSLEINRAIILALEGATGAWKRHLAAVKKEFAEVPQKGVRKECENMLDHPADPEQPAGLLARHAGLA